MIGSVLMTLTDADLLDLVRRGDETAFTELYTRHREVAQRMAATYGRRGEADDLVDLAFEKMLGALRRGRGPTGAFRAYLFVTLRRLAAEQAERPSEWPFDEVPEPLATASTLPGLDGSEREMITGAFESLPGRWQAVLWHTAVEGRHPRELASVLGMSANAVSALAYRARERLRQAYLQAHLQAAPRPECEPHRSSLGAYVRDGQRPRERRATIEHLERCRSCQALVAELVDINRSLARAVWPLFAATSAGHVASALGTAGLPALEAGTVVRRSVAAWARLHPVRGLVGGVAASSALLLGVTLRPHLEGDSPVPPAVGTTIEGAGGPDAGPEAAAEVVDAVDAVAASLVTACPVVRSRQQAEPVVTGVVGLVPAVVEPVLTGSSATTVPPGPSATPPEPAVALTEVVCTPTKPGYSDLTVVVTAVGEVLETADLGDLGAQLADAVPIGAEVTIDLSDGARVALGAGIPEGCQVTEERQSLVCALEPLVPGAPTTATVGLEVGLEVDLPLGAAPSATVTLSDGG